MIATKKNQLLSPRLIWHEFCATMSDQWLVNVYHTLGMTYLIGVIIATIAGTYPSYRTLLRV